MHDFEQRFGEVFRRILAVWWNGKGTVKTTVVTGRYPVNDKTLTPSTEPSPNEHESWKVGSHVVVEVFYPDDYSAENRKENISGPIPVSCASALIGLGLGPLLHNGNARDDAMIIHAPICEEIYKRLPPLEAWDGKRL